MTTLTAAALGAILGPILFAVFPSMAGIGAVLGATVGLLLDFQRRLRVLESRSVSGRPTRAAERRAVDVPKPLGFEPTMQRTECLRRGISPDVVDTAGRERRDVSVGAKPPTETVALRPSAHGSKHATEGHSPPVDTENTILSLARQWLGTGNIPAKVGVVLSLFGVGFLVKEAIDRNWLVLPIELRLAAVACFGIALIVIGWCLRQRRHEYAVSLQGGGIAVLYLCAFASFAIYGLLSPVLAFALLLVVTAAAGTMAVLQDSRVLAVLGIAGGFAAPLITSDGADNHVLLFSYYAILNVAVFGIAWFKSWRELNVLGFMFTFVIAGIWAVMAYRPTQFGSTEPFLILFTVMYLILPILFATKQPPNLRGFVDSTLVFGTPLVAFGLQAGMVAGKEFGLANTAAALAVIYAVLAAAVLRRRDVSLRVLGESYIGLSAVFFVLMVPLALDAQWTSVSWSLQGAAMVWLGWRQDRRLAQLAGVVLQLAAAGAYVLQDVTFGTGMAFFNATYLGAVLIALAAAFSSWVLERTFERRELREYSAAAWGLLAWATAWWLGAGLLQIDAAVSARYELNASLAFVAASVFAAMAWARAIDWGSLNVLGFMTMPAIVIAILGSGLPGHPFGNLGFIVWPLAIAVHFLFARFAERRLPQFNAWLHASGYWSIAAIVGLETYWMVDRIADGIWPASATIAVLSVFTAASLRLCEHIAWPLRAHEQIYKSAGSAGVLAVLGLLTVWLNTVSSAAAAPLSFVPLLNPLEAASCLYVVVAVYWYSLSAGRRRPFSSVQFSSAVALYGWVLLTMSIARTVHHWSGIPFELATLTASNVMQASLSIVWGGAALIAMAVGAHRLSRSVWFAGAGLMSVVVIKLFLVELGDTGTLARVVSFLGVGILLLVVGYLAPVPPRPGPTTRDNPMPTPVKAL